MSVKFITESEVPVELVPKWKVVVAQNDDGSVDIGVESENGYYNWSLFKLKTDGTFYRQEYVGKDSGFKLNKKGQIVESKIQ